MQSYLKWAGHISMSDHWTPKHLVYVQFQNGSHDRPLFCFNNKLKYNLKPLNILLSSFENKEHMS